MASKLGEIRKSVLLVHRENAERRAAEKPVDRVRTAREVMVEAERTVGVSPLPEPKEPEMPAAPDQFQESVEKVLVSARIDKDIVEWLKSKPGKYTANMNTALRKHMDDSK